MCVNRFIIICKHEMFIQKHTFNLFFHGNIILKIINFIPLKPYTIQLFASKDLTQAKNYIKHLNKPSNQYTIIQVNDWYKVTYQQYNSHKAAQHILPTLTKIEPKSWIYLIPNTAQTIVG